MSGLYFAPVSTLGLFDVLYALVTVQNEFTVAVWTQGDHSWRARHLFPADGTICWVQMRTYFRPLLWGQQDPLPEDFQYNLCFMRTDGPLLHLTADVPILDLCLFHQHLWQGCPHWGQGPKYPLGTWWKHWDRSQHMTLICPVVKCWVHFKYTLLCDPDMPSGYMLSTFWMCPAIWLQCTQWANNWAHFQCSAKSNHNVPSG